MTPDHADFIALVRKAIASKPDELFGYNDFIARVRRQIIMGLLEVIDALDCNDDESQGGYDDR